MFVPNLLDHVRLNARDPNAWRFEVFQQRRCEGTLRCPSPSNATWLGPAAKEMNNPAPLSILARPEGNILIERAAGLRASSVTNGLSRQASRKIRLARTSDFLHLLQHSIKLDYVKLELIDVLDEGINRQQKILVFDLHAVPGIVK